MTEDSLGTSGPLELQAGTSEDLRDYFQTIGTGFDDQSPVSSMFPARDPNQLIYRLPVETFIDVVLSAVDEIATRGDDFRVGRRGKALSYYSELVRYMLVSRRWRDIITQHPAFWCILDNSLDRRVWPLILSRSGETALHIAFIQNLGRSWHDDGILKEFVQTVSPLSERWVGLLLRVHRADLPSCLGLLARRAPRLRSLGLLAIAYGSDGLHPVTPLILSDIPGKELKHICIIAIRFEWNSTVFSGLVRLHLGCGGSLTLSQLFQTIHSSPRIQSLLLSNLDIQDDLQGRHWAPFVLPVVDLTLQSIPRPILRQILMHLQDIPNCLVFTLASMRVDFDDGPPTAAFLPSCLDHLLPHLQRVMSKASLDNFMPSLCLNTSDPRLMSLGLHTEPLDNRGLHISMSIDDWPDPQTCIWFNKLFSHAECRNIPFLLSLHPGFNWENSVHRSLFDGMNVLHIATGNDALPETVKSLLSYLQQKGVEDGAYHSTFPNLQRLSLHAKEFPWDELWEVVKVRCQSPNSHEGGLPFLVEISTDEVNLEVLDRLKKHLGDANVVCHLPRRRNRRSILPGH